MDPYVVIPEDHEPEVRKRVRDRDEEESRAPNKRSRVLSASNANAAYSATLQPPKPEDHLEGYNHQRLEQGLEYIINAAKRDITPRTRTFLKLHQEAYEKALTDPPKNPAAVAVVQALDQVYYTEAFYFKPRQGKDYEQLQALVKLRELEMLANYGDYLSQELPELRAELEEKSRGGSSEVREAAKALGPSTTWVQIADDLYKADLSGNIAVHVRVACGVLGIEAKHMNWLIQEWGARSRKFHNSAREYIQDCRWDDLKQLLCRDIRELFMVTDAKTAGNYNKVLLSLADKYYEIDDYDDPAAWYPREKSRELLRQLNEKKGKGKAIRKYH